MICRLRAVERVNVKLKPPTLTDPSQSRTKSQANKLWSSTDIMCSCYSFYLPLRRIPVFYLIFIPRVLQMGTRVEWSVFESPLWLSVLLCLTHNRPWLHMDTHTLSLLFLSFYLSHSIDCCNQTPGCSQVVWECLAIFHFSEPCWVEYSHFLCNQVTEWMRSRPKGETKGKHRSIDMEKKHHSLK